MARKKDFTPGVGCWTETDGDRQFVGLATSKVLLDNRVSVQLYATGKPTLYNYRLLTVDAPPRPQTLVRIALEHLIGGRRPFTADEVWDMLAHYPGVCSHTYKGTSAALVQRASEDDRIVSTGWAETERSLAASRTVRIWQPVASRAKRSAA